MSAQINGLYAITGASGRVGGGIARILLEAGRRVRAIGRSAERLQPLAAQGAEAFAASVDDAAAMARAFQGADAVFAMIPTDYASPDYRAQQKRIVAALAKAVADAKVPRVVILSSVGGQLPARTGPIVGLHELEEAMKSIAGVHVLSLRPGYFMENHFFGIPTIKSTGMYITPMRADLRLAMIATRDIAAAAAERLLKLDFSGHSARELQGQRDLSMTEVTAVLGKAIGKPDLSYVQAPYKDAEQAMLGSGLGPSIASLYIEMYKAFNDGLVRSMEQRGPATTTKTSIEDFAPSFAKAYQAG